ncbi:MAG: hypothetical protein ABSG13_07270 [Bryobacteraceae bacterium]
MSGRSTATFRVRKLRAELLAEGHEEIGRGQRLRYPPLRCRIHDRL